MSVTATGLRFGFDNTFVRELEGLYEPWHAATAPDPRVLVLNEPLAAELGLDPERLTAEVLTGTAVPEDAEPVAMAYAGHQFGGFVPRLGDGRALLLGEIVDQRGRRRDLHLKGSGRTPFARGGDGKAVVGPMLREYVIGEALHALGVPTSRALAVAGTGEQVSRGPLLPGAVLTRVAASHLRVGTFEYAARHEDRELLRRLADYAIARHHPQAAEADNPYLAFFEQVVDAQARLIARWILAGFVHGVMNTDNITISGETIDLGPCAFIDVFDPAAVFSSIDHGGRYSFGNQPNLAMWDLARLAETLIPLIGPDDAAAAEAATAVLQSFGTRFQNAWAPAMRAKLGLAADTPGELVDDFLTLLQEHHVDYTSALRDLARGTARDHFLDPAPFDAWAERWRAASPDTELMNQVNPVYIPRNHLVEEALEAATNGDLQPVHDLVEVLRDPFTERKDRKRYAEPAPESFGRYVTYCGT